VLQDEVVSHKPRFLRERAPGSTAAVLKGRGNYLSLARLREELIEAIDEERISRARAWSLSHLASFALMSADGDLEGVQNTIRGMEEYTQAEGEAFRIRDQMR